MEFLHWADKPTGLIDFALTTLPPTTAYDNVESTIARLKQNSGDLGVSYLSPKAGGRRRNDGVDVKWEVSRPDYHVGSATPDDSYFPTKRTDVPFFCHDITDRKVRVPFDDNTITTHPCGATGIASVEVLVPTSHLEAYVKAYSSITGVTARLASESDPNDGVLFHVAAPVARSNETLIWVHPPRNDNDIHWLQDRGIGIRGLSLNVERREGSGQQSLGKDGMASTISLSWQET